MKQRNWESEEARDLYVDTLRDFRSDVRIYGNRLADMKRIHPAISHAAQTLDAILTLVLEAELS